MAAPSGNFFLRLGGVTTVGLLTYLGEYISYLVILAWVQDRLVLQFQFGTFAPVVVGIVAGAYLVISGFLAIPFGHVADKYGRRPLAVLGATLGGMALLSLLGIGGITDPTVFLVAVGGILIALGFGHATYTASTWAYVGDIAHEHNLGKSYGLLEIAEYGGFAFGPGVGILSATVFGREPTFAVSAALVLSAAFIAYIFMSESSTRPPLTDDPATPGNVDEHNARISWGSFLEVLKNPVVAATLATTFFMSLALQAFYIYVPLFATGTSNVLGPYGATSGFLATIAAGTSIVMMVPFGFTVDATGRRMPWLTSGLLVGSLSLVMVYVFRNFFFLAGAALVFGVALAMARVSQAVILAEGSVIENRATVMGTNHAVEHAGYGVGALTAGVLLALIGFGSTFRDLAFVLLVVAAVFLIFAIEKKLR